MPDQNSKKKLIGINIKKSVPKISIIIPAYNTASFIKETLDSVFAQTFQDFEIILVNDGSPDSANLEKVLQPYLDKIIYIEQENRGTAAARNTAIYAARGEYLAFLDGDDIWFPEYLEAQINVLNDKKCDLIYADALLFGDVSRKFSTYMTKAPSSGEVTAESLLSAKCNVITSGTIVRREKILQVGLFDESLPRIGMEDFDLWFRLAKNGARLDYQKQILFKYRVRPNSLSGTNVARIERSIRGLNIIAGKYELTATEKSILKERSVQCKAEFELEKGKLCLINQEYGQAKIHITAANKFYHKPKLTLIKWFLWLSPKMTLRLFKTLRPSEFSFISMSNLPK